MSPGASTDWTSRPRCPSVPSVKRCPSRQACQTAEHSGGCTENLFTTAPHVTPQLEPAADTQESLDDTVINHSSAQTLNVQERLRHASMHFSLDLAGLTASLHLQPALSHCALSQLASVVPVHPVDLETSRPHNCVHECAFQCGSNWGSNGHSANKQAYHLYHVDHEEKGLAYSV